MKKIILIIIAYFLAITQVTAEENNLVNIYLIHSNNCSHCKEELEFLELVEAKYKNVKIYKYEISENTSQEIIKKIETIYNVKVNSIPFIIIGNTYYKGYSKEQSPPRLVTTINYYSEYGYQDKLGENIKNVELPTKEIEKNQIGVEEYLKKNSNHKIIFNIRSDKIDLNTSSSILGLIEPINLINIIFITGMVIIIAKIKNKSKKIIAYGIFLIATLNFKILSYFIEENSNLTIKILLLLIFVISILMIFKKSKHLTKYILIIAIIKINLILQNIFELTKIDTLKKIMDLNLTISLNKILNITIYMFSYILTNIMIILIINKIIEQKKHKKCNINSES